MVDNCDCGQKLHKDFRGDLVGHVACPTVVKEMLDTLKQQFNDEMKKVNEVRMK